MAGSNCFGFRLQSFWNPALSLKCSFSLRPRHKTGCKCATEVGSGAATARPTYFPSSSLFPIKSGWKLKRVSHREKSLLANWTCRVDEKSCRRVRTRKWPEADHGMQACVGDKHIFTGFSEYGLIHSTSGIITTECFAPKQTIRFQTQWRSDGR